MPEGLTGTEWTRAYYGHLVGATVVSIDLIVNEYGDDDEVTTRPATDKDMHYEVWPQITIEKDGQRYVLEVSQDEEGNGPGFLFGLPDPRGGE